LIDISEKNIDVAELEKADYFELYANVLKQLGGTARGQSPIQASGGYLDYAP
jgi:hypothetical protein